MGIKALKLTAVDRYVSDSDPGKNATFVNEAAILEWDKANENKKKELRPTEPRPEPVYTHTADATVWLLGTLDSITMSALADDMTSLSEDGGLKLRQADNEVVAARLGLRGWENFFDEDGQQITFVTETIVIRGRRVEALAEHLLGAIPLPVLRELGREIKERNSLTAVQAKNSVSASSL